MTRFNVLDKMTRFNVLDKMTQFNVLDKMTRFNVPEGISSSLRDFIVLVFNIELFQIKFS